ncbi:hypothetical protein A5881_003877 [Enterococcus termitis]
MKRRKVDTDEWIARISNVGVPVLVIIVLVNFSSYTGAVAITTSLAFLGGPLGMIGGIGLLAIIGLISQKLTEHGIEKVMMMVVKEQLKGKTKKKIIETIESYPISKKLKLKVISYVEKTELD